MTGRPGALERAIEVALTLGLLVSGGLLIGGLALGATGSLKAGIVLLMATPVVRVVVVTFGLLVQRDWVFALVSLWVLATLGLGIFLAAHL